MNARIPLSVSAALLLLLSACGQDEPTKQPQEKTFGGKLGDSYKGMLDGAQKGVDSANEHTQSTDRAVQERNH